MNATLVAQLGVCGAPTWWLGEAFPGAFEQPGHVLHAVVVALRQDIEVSCQNAQARADRAAARAINDNAGALTVLCSPERDLPTCERAMDVIGAAGWDRCGTARERLDSLGTGDDPVVSEALGTVRAFVMARCGPLEQGSDGHE